MYPFLFLVRAQLYSSKGRVRLSFDPMKGLVENIWMEVVVVRSLGIDISQYQPTIVLPKIWTAATSQFSFYSSIWPSKQGSNVVWTDTTIELIQRESNVWIVLARGESAYKDTWSAGMIQRKSGEVLDYGFVLIRQPSAKSNVVNFNVARDLLWGTAKAWQIWY